MQVHHGINHLPAFKHAVLTTGMFDGVHIAHQRLLATINTRAKEQHSESVLITFWPHPQMILDNEHRKPLHLLNTLEEKIQNLERTGIDHLVVVPFDLSFAKMSAEDYIENFLVKHFKPKTIVIGFNHRFGFQRKGDVNLLQQFGIKHQYSVMEFDQQIEESISISSTNVRKAVAEGMMEEAEMLLGNAYSLAGIVIKGQQVGRTIQFPTANLQMNNKDKLIPKIGVYCVKVQINGIEHQGMMNIGMRPTVDGRSLSLEVHIFNFDQDIYDSEITIKFLHRLRDETKFESIAALKEQLELDKKNCLHFFQTKHVSA